MYHIHTTCRACGYAAPRASGIKSPSGEKLTEVFDLGIQPLANDFCREGEAPAGYAPLKVLLCPRCSLAQLSVVVDPEILYRKYAYVTSPSRMMQSHFQALFEDIAAEAPGSKTVLEIGSNDGRMLAMMQGLGYSVMGVEPAKDLAEKAHLNGIRTEPAFFNEDLARVLHQHDVIIARHVFCHIDDWRGFMRALASVSHQETLICIEAPYVGDTLKNCEFDQVYHEHLSFLSIKAMKALLANSPFRLHRIIRYTIHGGVILIMLSRKDPVRRGASESFIERDEDIGLDAWESFSNCANAQIAKLGSTVEYLQAQGKTVAGLGASAKSTVWVNACGFNRRQISFIADNTPQKQLTVSPGTDIPIADEGAILRELPDYVILFAWNYREEILDKFSLARSKGVKFIIPVPAIEIV